MWAKGHPLVGRYAEWRTRCFRGRVATAPHGTAHPDRAGRPLGLRFGHVTTHASRASCRHPPRRGRAHRCRVRRVGASPTRRRTATRGPAPRPLGRQQQVLHRGTLRRRPPAGRMVAPPDVNRTTQVSHEHRLRWRRPLLHALVNTSQQPTSSRGVHREQVPPTLHNRADVIRLVVDVNMPMPGQPPHNVRVPRDQSIHIRARLSR